MKQAPRSSNWVYNISEDRYDSHTPLLIPHLFENIGPTASSIRIRYDLRETKLLSFIETQNWKLLVCEKEINKVGNSSRYAVYKTDKGQIVDIVSVENRARVCIYFCQESEGDALLLSKVITNFKLKKIHLRPSMHIMVSEYNSLAIKEFEIKMKRVDVGLLYGDMFFSQKYVTISRLLKESKRPGLFIFHGPPGTGKSIFIRHLVQKIRGRDFIFIPIDLATHLADPNILSLFLEHKNAVLVLEDSEQLLMPRRESGLSAYSFTVSNLLNLCDGILGDLLNFQIICTFNCELKEVDPALLRSGRLLTEHRFDLIPPERARRVAEIYGLDVNPIEPTSLAELFYPREENPLLGPKRGTIGFSAPN